MELSRRFRGTHKVRAALSDEIKEQIRQRVYEMMNNPSEAVAAPADSGVAPVADGAMPGPASENAVSESPDGFADGGEAESQLSLEQGPVPTEQQPSSDNAEAAPQAEGAVDMPQGEDSMANADEGAQAELSPTTEMNFDDDGTDAFDMGDGDDFDFGDLSIGGEDDGGDEFPELIPPKSRRNQEATPAPAPAAETSAAEPAPTAEPTPTTSNSFGEEVPVEKSAPAADTGTAEVKNPTKNTKVPTLSENKEASIKVASVLRRGRFDKLILLASKGNYAIGRKDADTMPQKGDYKPQRDPEERAPKRNVTKNTSRQLNKQDPDIGKNPDARKD